MPDPRRTFAALSALALAACVGEPDPVSPEIDPPAAETPAARMATLSATALSPERAREAAVIRFAARLEADVRRTRPEVFARAAWWTGDVAAGAMGGEVLFSDRGDKTLGIEWVPGDPRRNDRYDIGYALPDAPIVPPGLGATDFEEAIDRAMATWDRETCSGGLSITRGTLLDWLLFDSDVLHAGLASLPPGVIGLTVSFAFLDGPDQPSDIDGNGAADYAFAIIFYSNAFPWAIDGNIDVESVVLHEMGHGLGQDHFGKGFITLANDRGHLAPAAVMNAGYTGVRQSLTGTDRAGHCTLFGAWPAG